MGVVNIRELARRTSEVVDAVASTKRPALVTRRGRPVAAVIPIDGAALEDWILANAPEFVEGMRRADRELRAGKTVSLDALLAGLGRQTKRRSTRKKAGRAG